MRPRLLRLDPLPTFAVSDIFCGHRQWFFRSLFGQFRERRRAQLAGEIALVGARLNNENGTGLAHIAGQL